MLLHIYIYIEVNMTFYLKDQTNLRPTVHGLCTRASQ